MLIEKNDVILFQGDSITDAFRMLDKENNGYGFGYAKICKEVLHALYPDYQLTFYNKGVSGNRVKDLKARWQEDCLDLKPTLVSIFIGINDTWHRFGLTGEVISPEEFKKDYMEIIQKTKAIGAKLMMIEPFAFHHGAFSAEWREDLTPKIQVIRTLAAQYADAYVPLDGIMAEETLRTPAVELSEDGVHPSEAGYRVIAKAWLRAAGIF